MVDSAGSLVAAAARPGRNTDYRHGTVLRFRENLASVEAPTPS
ncbi:hypothetical protein [Streptomyces albipurpureus]|nr:hypothetical protein [Streptomyces sp. CWNU-1]